jgi:hypothetical protein
MSEFARSAADRKALRGTYAIRDELWKLIAGLPKTYTVGQVISALGMVVADLHFNELPPEKWQAAIERFCHALRNDQLMKRDPPP